MVDVNAHVTTSPHTVEPGETDWLFTQTFREDDNIEGHELTLTLSLTDRTNGDAHELDILETQINEEGVIGRAENQTDEFVDMVDVAVATYDDAGELLSITFSYIETLKPGQTQPFEAYLDYYPYSLSEVADVDVRGYGYVFEQ